MTVGPSEVWVSLDYLHVSFASVLREQELPWKFDVHIEGKVKKFVAKEIKDGKVLIGHVSKVKADG